MLIGITFSVFLMLMMMSMFSGLLARDFSSVILQSKKKLMLTSTTGNGSVLHD